jgi:putative transposase
VLLKKTYRFRMEPNSEQRMALSHNAGSRRWVWNWALGRKQRYYRDTGKGLRTSSLSAELPMLKRQPETAWLAEADSQSLQETLRDLDRAFKNFFEGRARFPRFKSRKRDEPRFRVSQRVSVADGSVLIPKIGPVRIRQSQPVDCDTKSATFKRDVTVNWHVTLVAEFTMPDTALPLADPTHVVGVDLGLKEFAVLSDGERLTIPQFFRKAERKLRRAQRVFSRREKDSARRLRAKRNVSLVHRRVTNQRKGFCSQGHHRAGEEVRWNLHRGSECQRPCENQAGQIGPRCCLRRDQAAD